MKCFESCDVTSAILEYCLVNDIRALYNALRYTTIRADLVSGFLRLNKLFISINTSKRSFNKQVAWSSKHIAYLPEIYFVASSSSSDLLNLNDRNFENLITSFEFLKVICMSEESNCKNISKSFRRLKTLLETLTELNLRLLSSIMDSDLHHFCEGGSNKLKLLNLTGAYKISDAGIDYVAKASRNLQFLDISECTHLTDRSIESLTENCKNLKELNLSGLVEITDYTLSLLAQNCTFLSMLDLTDIGNITDKGIDTLTKGCPLLMQLDLSLCVNITDKALISLAKHSRCLSKLSLFWCDHITYEGMKALCNNGSNKLQDIDISRCGGLSDKAVSHIVRNCPHLVNLDVCENNWISDKSLFAILKYGLHKIRYLNLSACDKISPEGFTKFIKRQHFKSGALTTVDFSFCLGAKKIDPTMIRAFEFEDSEGKKKTIVFE